jgi:hypothetical protein
MKALKTVVATAVIVFTLTTVAMAGVQQLSRRGDTVTQAGAPQQAAAQPAAQGGVTLSAHQFAALLSAVDGDSQHQSGARKHAATRSRSHTRQQSQVHAASGATGNGTSAVTQHTAVHNIETHHTATQATSHSGGTHDGGTHDGGTHDGGTHDGGTHDGGCD